MEFTEEFTVPAGIDRAFAILTDLERVAPCLPGATLDSVDGSVYSGRMKVRVGPMQVTYQGTAELRDVDPDAKRAVIVASGRDLKSAGTASAGVVAQLTEEADATRVTVVTDIDVTGKPAQFGRGVMADVGANIIRQFAGRLEELLRNEEPTAAPGAPEGAPARNGRVLAHAERSRQDAPSATDESLDLIGVAGGPLLKRLAPVVAGLAVLALWRWRRRRRTARIRR